MGNNMQAFYDGMTLVGSLVVMAAVIALAYYGSRWYAGRVGASVSGRYIKILDRVTISPGCAIVVIQAGERFYLIGVSEKNTQMLCELPDFNPGMSADVFKQASFGQIFQGFLKKSGSPEDNGGESETKDS